MAFRLSEFTSALKGGGARSSLFEVSLAGSGPAGSIPNLKFLCRATTIPPSNIAPIDVPFLGRVIKVAGDRTFEPWTITILNDENFAIRSRLEGWMDQIKSHQGIRQRASSISGYQQNMVLTQYTKNGKKSQQYVFVNAWPSSVSEIPLAWDAPAIEEFTCTWNYDYWKSTSIKITTVTQTNEDGTTTETEKVDYSNFGYPKTTNPTTSYDSESLTQDEQYEEIEQETYEDARWNSYLEDNNLTGPADKSTVVKAEPTPLPSGTTVKKGTGGYNFNITQKI